MYKSGVYQIILKEDGRSYVGSAIDIKKRWNNHKSKANSNTDMQVIARAIAKHGFENFEWKILEECSVENLIEREQYWLDKIRPFADENHGFNVRKIAKSNYGIKRSIESRKKQSQTMLGVAKTEEHKKNMSKSWHNSRDENYYKMLSERVSGDKNPAKRPEVRQKISASMTGKTWKHNKDRVQAHIDKRKGKKYSDAAKANMKAAQQKNKTRSPKAKENFYIAQRVLYEITSPEGNTFQIYSRELKLFCKEHNLTYANLIGTAKTNKFYKKGWKAKVI